MQSCLTNEDDIYGSKKTKQNDHDMKIISKIWCFLKGHDWLEIYKLDNSDIFDGQWRSSWGMHKCMRCKKEETWQYDRL